MGPKKISLILLSIGVCLFTYSLFLPKYNDSLAYEKLQNAEYYSDFDKGEYYDKEVSFRTHKVLFLELGASLVATFGSLYLFFAIHKINSIWDIKNVQSPNRNKIFIWGNIGFFSQNPAAYLYELISKARMDNPPFKDYHTNPTDYVVFAYLILLLPFNLFLIFTTYKTVHPISIFNTPNNYSNAASFWMILLNVFIVLNLFSFLALFITGEAELIPFSLYFTYLLFSFRAGKINRHSKP